MSRVFVSNIPEKFTPQDLQMLLQQANIPCTNPEPLKINKSKRYRNDGSSGSTGRFIILNFDSDVLSNTAMEAINLMVLTVDGKETNIRATPFIPNFRQYLENPMNNLVIYNIPVELTTSDLVELFSECGTILSARVLPPRAAKAAPKAGDAARTTMGFVLFQTAEHAAAAKEHADGKFLGACKLHVGFFRTLQQRMAANAEVLLTSIPRSFTEESVKKLVSEAVHKTDAEIFAGIVTIREDSRPEIVNSNGSAAIFTCTSPEMAKIVIEAVNALNFNFTEEGVKEPCKMIAKLTKGMLAYLKSNQQAENRLKYAESGRNVQVFGLRTDITQEEVKAFFTRYGAIDEISCPNRADVEQNIFHYNILFSKQEEAAKAIQNGVQDEKNEIPRLSMTGLRIALYEGRKDVQSTKARKTRDTVGASDAQ